MSFPAPIDPCRNPAVFENTKTEYSASGSSAIAIPAGNNRAVPVPSATAARILATADRFLTIDTLTPRHRAIEIRVGMSLDENLPSDRSRNDRSETDRRVSDESVPPLPDCNRGPSFWSYQRVLKAASNAAAGGSKAKVFTNLIASGAPIMRSMPASSHSTERGPSYPMVLSIRKQSSQGTSP